MIRHIVLWRLKGDTPAERLALAGQLKSALEGLNGRIPGMRFLEVGIDYSAGPDSSTVALYAEFDNRDALVAYHDHPAHLEVAPLVKAARTERRVVDYESEG